MGSFLMGSLRKVLANLRGRGKILEITVPKSRRYRKGGIAPFLPCFPFCLVSMWYRASIAEIPLFSWGGGGFPTPLRMVSKEETLREGGGGIAPNWPC